MNSTSTSRIPINTKELQKAFPGTYRDFFSKCQIVTSASNNFFWIGEFSALFGGLATLQKLPTRTYIGLEFVDNPKIGIESLTSFLPSRKGFSERILDTYVTNRLSRFLETEFLQEAKNKSPGVIIHTLSESPISVGLNISAASAAALAAAILLWSGRDDLEKSIKDWPKAKSFANLIKDPANHFREIFSLAWKLEAIFHSDAASGSGVAAAMAFSNYPIVYFTEYRMGDTIDHGKARFPLNSYGDLEMYSKINFWAYSLEDLFSIKPLFSFPIDYTAIYSGQRQNIISAKGMVKANTTVARKLADFTKVTFPSFFARKTDPPAEVPRFIERIKNTDWPIFFHWYIDGPQNVLALSNLSLMSSFYNDDYTESSIRAFLENINNSTKALSLTPVLSPEYAITFLEKLKKSVAKLCGNNFGIKILEIGSGSGAFLVAVPSGMLRGEKMQKLIDELRDITGNNQINIDHASWRDGFGTEGLKIEQSVLRNIYSDFVTKESLQVLQIDAQGTLHSSIISQGDRHTIQSELMIDLVDEKVFIGGKTPNSKQLPSASATARILGRLLQTPGLSLKNSSMPRSSYASSRHELQSKIITPLNKLLKKRIKKTLRLKIHGDLTDFHLNLEPPIRPTITMIKKMF